jgi:NhaP-type Na+/H+ or K+/H+ antiporter
VKWQLSIVALSVLLVATGSRRLSGTSLTPAMMFVALGLLAGPLVANDLDPSVTSHSIRTLAEATLAIVLFLDASRIRFGALRHEYSVPVRLLAIGLPLTIALGTGVALGLFSGLSAAEALVLAVVLAPTDAALGEAVVTEPTLPSRIRQGLNVESGLNDGICVPLLLIALALADVESAGVSAGHAWHIVAEEIGYGILAGAGAGLLTAALSGFGLAHNLISGIWLRVIPVAGAALAYGSAVALGGSGFIAAFVAGGLFGGLLPEPTERASALGEEVGGLLGGVTFLLYGAILLGPTLEKLSWQIVLYALLSLTLIRMLPVAVAMLGTGARTPTIGFLGWFGPRGLASIVFAVIVIEESHLPGATTILLTIYTTIGLSVLAHGLSAAPLARRYARWYAAQTRSGEPAMEDVPADYHRSRGGRTSLV